MAYYSFMADKFSTLSYARWSYIVLPSLALQPTSVTEDCSCLCEEENADPR
uniref:Uncharacterized protein n=1 Tax=Triticum urartu TaxID=4572 RepID=A0A8R7UQ11_TRIUA